MGGRQTFACISPSSATGAPSTTMPPTRAPCARLAHTRTSASRQFARTAAPASFPLKWRLDRPALALNANPASLRQKQVAHPAQHASLAPTTHSTPPLHARNAARAFTLIKRQLSP